MTLTWRASGWDNIYNRFGLSSEQVSWKADGICRKWHIYGIYVNARSCLPQLRQMKCRRCVPHKSYSGCLYHQHKTWYALKVSFLIIQHNMQAYNLRKHACLINLDNLFLSHVGNDFHNERLTAKRFIFDKKYLHGPCCPEWCNQSLQGNFSTLLGIVWCSFISCEIQMHCNLVINRWIFWKRVTEDIAIDFAITNYSMCIVHPYVSVVYDIMVYWVVFVEKPQIIPIQVRAQFITSAQLLIIK